MQSDSIQYGLGGRRFLITGSTRGIGRALAERLLAEGATVGIHGRSEAAVHAACTELEPLSKRTLPLAADLDQPEQAARLVERFCEGGEVIDGLCNNAGSGEAVAFRGIKLDSWRKTFRVNLESALLASQAAFTRMRKQKQGSIVNIASLAAHGPAGLMGADYAASKAALISLTRTLAQEGARFNVRVNAVSPGFVDTDMVSDLPQDKRAALPIPLGRLASPDEIAHTIAFLFSDGARYFTGQTLRPDGGLSIQG